jgi:hypothetical protein
VGGGHTRVALLRNCMALMLPSLNESFSRVLYEAWYAGKPAAVRRLCEATRIPLEGVRRGMARRKRGGVGRSARATWRANRAIPPPWRSSGSAGGTIRTNMRTGRVVMDRYEQILMPPEPQSARRGARDAARGDPSNGAGDRVRRRDLPGDVVHPGHVARLPGIVPRSSRSTSIPASPPMRRLMRPACCSRPTD